MQVDAASIIRVQSEWNSWQTVGVRLEALRDVHWSRPAGAPQPLLHGYVSCADFIGGDLPHACHGAHSPHDLLVCVLRKHTADAVYADLTRRASERMPPPRAEADAYTHRAVRR